MNLIKIHARLHTLNLSRRWCIEMPERARVFVAEDNQDWQRTIEMVLERFGHSVILRAETLDDALKAIEQFEKLDVQVATIDGNLSPNDTSGHDVHALVEAITRIKPLKITRANLI